MLSETDSRTSLPLNQAQTPCVSSRAGCAAGPLTAGTWAVAATTGTSAVGASVVLERSREKTFIG